MSEKLISSESWEENKQIVLSNKKEAEDALKAREEHLQIQKQNEKSLKRLKATIEKEIPNHFTESFKEKIENIHLKINQTLEKWGSLQPIKEELRKTIDAELDRLNDNLLDIADTSVRDFVEKHVDVIGVFESVYASDEIEDFFELFTIEYINFLEERNLTIDTKANNLNLSKFELRDILKRLNKIINIDKDIKFTIQDDSWAPFEINKSFVLNNMNIGIIERSWTINIKKSKEWSEKVNIVKHTKNMAEVKEIIETDNMRNLLSDLIDFRLLNRRVHVKNNSKVEIKEGIPEDDRKIMIDNLINFFLFVIDVESDWRSLVKNTQWSTWAWLAQILSTWVCKDWTLQSDWKCKDWERLTSAMETYLNRLILLSNKFKNKKSYSYIKDLIPNSRINYKSDKKFTDYNAEDQIKILIASTFAYWKLERKNNPSEKNSIKNDAYTHLVLIALWNAWSMQKIYTGFHHTKPEVIKKDDETDFEKFIQKHKPTLTKEDRERKAKLIERYPVLSNMYKDFPKYEKMINLEDKYAVKKNDKNS